METKEKKHSKLKSVKTWLAIWAAANFSLVVWGIIFKHAEGLTPIALGLLTIIAGYFGVNVYQKKLYKDGEKEA